MASIIKIKRSTTAGAEPAALQAGELAINLVDKKIFSSDGTTVFTISTADAPNYLQVANATLLFNDRMQVANTNALVNDRLQVANATLLINDRIQVANATLLINDRLQVANATLLFDDRMQVANTNALVNDRLQVANATLLFNDRMQVANTILLVEDRLQVANATLLFDDRMQVANTNALVNDRMQVANTILLVNDRLQVANAAALYVTIVDPSTTGTLFHADNAGIGGNLEVSGNLQIDGDLTVTGATTYLSTQTLNVDDTMVKLAANNAADTVDSGIYAKYVEAAEVKYAGYFRDATDGVFRFYYGLGTEPGTTVDTNDAGIETATIEATIDGGTY